MQFQIYQNLILDINSGLLSLLKTEHWIMEAKANRACSTKMRNLDYKIKGKIICGSKEIPKKKEQKINKQRGDYYS